MKQECRLWNVWMAWIALPGIALVAALVRGWWVGALVLAGGAAAQLTYVRWFPHLSLWLGYGSVADVLPQASTRAGVPARVTLYTARGCPFCPILRQRLGRLQGELGFEMTEQDVTFHPRLLAAKGIRSVPVVEAHGRFLVGNATSSQLMDFLRKSIGAETSSTA